MYKQYITEILITQTNKIKHIYVGMYIYMYVVNVCIYIYMFWR